MRLWAWSLIRTSPAHWGFRIAPGLCQSLLHATSGALHAITGGIAADCHHSHKADDGSWMSHALHESQSSALGTLDRGEPFARNGLGHCWDIPLAAAIVANAWTGRAGCHTATPDRLSRICLRDQVSRVFITALVSRQPTGSERFPSGRQSSRTSSSLPTTLLLHRDAICSVVD